MTDRYINIYQLPWEEFFNDLLMPYLGIDTLPKEYGGYPPLEKGRIRVNPVEARYFLITHPEKQQITDGLIRHILIAEQEKIALGHFSVLRDNVFKEVCNTYQRLAPEILKGTGKRKWKCLYQEISSLSPRSAIRALDEHYTQLLNDWRKITDFQTAHDFIYDLHRIQQFAGDKPTFESITAKTCARRILKACATDYPNELLKVIQIKQLIRDAIECGLPITTVCNNNPSLEKRLQLDEVKLQT